MIWENIKIDHILLV